MNNRVKTCRICRETKSVDEFQSSGWSKTINGSKRRQYKSSCKNCFNKVEREKYHNELDNLVGKWQCILCGYNKTKSAIDFHHINPQTKLFAIRGVSRKKIHHEEMLAELKKCMMVCSNCHREIHEDIREMCREFGWKESDYVFVPVEVYGQHNVQYPDKV